MPTVFRHAACYLALAFSANAYAAPTGLLNDTGQTACLSEGNFYSVGACTPANSGDAASFPCQDGRFGRDAAAAAGVLPKTGAALRASTTPASA